MSKFLKGNYEVHEKDSEPKVEKEKSLSDLFESKAMERLGGSIAFVMKSNKFVWDEENEDTE